MKKKYLILTGLLFAWMGAQPVSAQTDVTSKYIKNADFETTPITFTKATGTTPQTARIGTTGQVYTVAEWTNASVIGNNAAQISSVEYGLGESVANGLNGTTPPSADNNGNGGSCVHMSAGWNDDAIMTQQIKLPAGKYSLTYYICNQNEGKEGIAENFTGIKYADGSVKYGTLKTAPYGQWVSETIYFDVTVEQALTLSVGFTTSSDGSGNGAKLYVDNLTLRQWGLAGSADNPEDFSVWVGNDKASWVGASGTYSDYAERFLDGKPTGEYLSQTLTNLPLGIYELELYCCPSSTASRDGGAQAVTDGSTEYVTLSCNDVSQALPSYNRLGVTLPQETEKYTLSNIKVVDGTLKIAVNIEKEGPNWIIVKAGSLKYLGIEKDFYAGILKEVNDNYNNSFGQKENKEAFKAAIDAVDAAQNPVEVTNALYALESARQAYMLVAQPKEGYSFDLTFKINNAAVASTDGWTNATTASGEQYDGAPDNTYLDRGWNGTLNATQVIANLPAGKYTLKAATRSYNPNESNIYVEHDGTTDRTTVHNDNNVGGELGNGWSWTEVPFTLVSGDVKIGFYADCGNNQWAGADDFHITYAGVADASAAYEAQKNLVQPLLASKMSADVRTTLTTLCGLTADNTRDELLQAMFDLKDAMTAAEASIAAYAYLQREVATAKSLGLDVATVEGNIAAESYTTEAAIAEAQAQNVAVYNKVKESYAYDVPVEDWTGDIGTAAGQHWSGDASRSYYDTNGADFSKSLATTVTLPAGEYVLMAAGRSASNATMDLKIDDTTVRFTAKGDTGYGIETSGQANFSESGTYANGGVGRGWEWEYVHLTLTEEKTVNLSATITTSGWGWGSFSDITLKMDQATFEAVYYTKLKTALDECKPWNAGNTYADTTYPGYENAYNNKTYTTVEEIEAAIAALKEVFDAYALENANAEHPYEMTDIIKSADCTVSDPDWPGSGRDTDKGQHWSGDANRVYFRQNHENGPARSQKITLNKVGAYLLKTSVRIVKPGAYATISVGDASETTNEVLGTTGGTIATDGTEWNTVEEGIAAGKTFANDNKGYGWVYNDVYFGAVSESDFEKTISINLSDYRTEYGNREANCGGMKLYYIGKNHVNTKDGVIGYCGIFNDESVALTDEVQAVDVTQATFSSFTVDRTNPNGLVYAKAGQLTETGNVVVDGTCANLVLADGHPFAAPKTFTATKAAYNMTAVATTADGKGFGTLCLPFEATILAGQAYKLDQGVTAGGELYATEVTTVPANTPVLVTAAGTYSAENASVAAVKATDLREGGELVGVYASTQAPVGSYVLQKHTDKVAFYPVVGVQPTVKPFRAYIRPQGEAASYSMLSVVFGFDEETAIDTVETAEGVKEVSRHDAAGVRISCPQKGLNIIRMSDGSVRKVIIK